MEDTEEKTARDNKMIIAIFTAVGVLLAGGSGIAYALMQDEPKGREGMPLNDGYVAGENANGSNVSERGALVLEPQTLTLQASENGLYKGSVSITASGQSVRLSPIQINNATGLKIESDCPGQGFEPGGGILAAGSRCIVSAVFDSTAPNVGFQGSPNITISGTTKTPGGTDFPVEYRINVVAAEGVSIPQIDANGIPIGGPQNPGGLSVNTDPFGAAPPPPPPTYTQPPASAMAGPAAYPTLGAEPTQMSPRDQLQAARRQPALSQTIQGPTNAIDQRRQASGHTSNWQDLNIPTSRSSMPVNMTRVLTMDRVITAVLTRAIDSRNPIQVTAQVDRNVYGAEGRTILIPRGSTLIGTPTGGGSERMAISWTQIIRPDGARFVLEANSADAQGAGGVPGFRDERNLKRYGTILLGTALNAAIAAGLNAQVNQAAINGGVINGQNTGAIVSDIIREDLRTVVADIVQRNSEMQTITRVPAGTRITVVPTQDLQLAAAGGHTSPRPRGQTNMPAGPQAGQFNSAPKNTPGGNNPAAWPAPNATPPPEQNNEDVLTSPSPRPGPPVPLEQNGIPNSPPVPSWARQPE